MTQPDISKLYVEDDLSGCWIWQGNYNQNGYPRVDGWNYAHHVMWEKVNGPIPEGMQLHHTCEEPGCVNPEHLVLKTPSQHQLDHVKERNENRETCINGHPWKENLVEYRRANGQIVRRCRRCKRLSNIAYKKRTRS